MKRIIFNKTFLLVTIIFLMAFAVRSLPFVRSIFVDGNVVFCDTDPYYHMRRITHAVRNNLNLIEFDSFLNYPDGAASIWPPLFDEGIALSILLLKGPNASQKSIERIAAWVPPFIGSLTVFIGFLIGKTLFSKKIGLLSAFFLAFQPIFLDYSKLGKVDHHVAEVFLCLLTFWFFIKTYKEDKSLYAILTGIGIYLSYMAWTGAILYVFPLWGTLFIVTVLYRDKNFANKSLIIFITAFLLLLYPCLTSWWGKRWLFAHDGLSLFQPVLFLFIVIFFLILRILVSLVKKRVFILSGLMVSMALISLLFFILFPDAFGSMFEGFRLLAKRGGASYNVWLTTIAENSPLLWDGTGIRWLRAVPFLTWGFFLVPFSLLILVFMSIYKKIFWIDTIFIWLWTVFFGFLCLNQHRYGYIFGFNVSLLSAFFLFTVFDYLKNNVREKISGIIKHLFLLVFVYFIFFVQGSIIYYSIRFSSRVNILTPEDYKTLTWIKENTPPVSADKPQYGIMALWDWGHFIEYLSERPAAVNPFGMGMDKMTNFFLAKTEKDANKVLEENKCRFVITGDLMSILEALRKISRQYPGQLYQYISKESGMLTIPKAEFLSLVGIRLHLYDGTKPVIRDSDIEGLSHYRLIYESGDNSEICYTGGPATLKKIKVFEYVRGVEIKGDTNPYSEVKLTLPVLTNQGRSFNYENRVKADKNGNFSIILPYATESSNYSVKAGSDYILNTGGKSLRIRAREKDIISGSVRKI